MIDQPCFDQYSDQENWHNGNLIANGDFAGTPGALPTGWEAICPNPALAPTFMLVPGLENATCLQATGNGRRECFGYVRHPVTLRPGATYRLRIRLRYEGLEDLNRHLVHGVFGGFNDGIFAYRRAQDWIIGEGLFPATGEVAPAEVRLYFRFSPHGRVWWHQVSLQESEPIPPRPLRIACSWGKGDLAYWASWLDHAGQKGADIALLPETFNNKPVAEAEPLDGPSGNLMAEKALRWHMWVSGTFYERCGDLAFNTAPLYDRRGALHGTYAKNQLYDPEEDQGATPGSGFPVFHTELGTLGIIICYDSWFPETVRLLAYKGAEVVLFPNAGYFAGLMPARAADNGVWIAVSSLSGPAGIWDPSGARAGETLPDPTRYAETGICTYEEDQALRMVIATIDLSRRFSPHWWGGPMRAAPAARRVRQTLIQPIEDEIAREARRWWKEDGAP